MPMGLPSNYRRSPSFVHTVALAPPGVLATDVIPHLIGKLVEGTVDGIETYSPDGTPVTIFLDLLGFLTDFHESSDGVGTFQHNGVAGCNLCSFRRDQGTNPTEAAYAFSTDSHSSNSSVQRTTTRQTDILRSNPPDADLTHLGIHSYRTDEDPPYPLLTLEVRLASAFATLQTVLNRLFREALFNNALPRQRQVFNISSKSLHSVTFSSLFGIFLVSPAVFKLFSSYTGVVLGPGTHAVFDICCSLHSLVSDLYFWPDGLSDGALAVDHVFGSGKRTYYNELQTSARSYLREVNDFHIAHPTLGRLLDVPNLHRLLELTIHTIPRYGHIRNVSDLTFESSYRRRLYTNFLISCFIGRSSLTSVSLYSPSFQRDAVEVFKGLCTPSFVAELSFLSRLSKIRRPSPVLTWTWNRPDHPPSYLISNRTDSERSRINTLIDANFTPIVRSLLRVSFSVSAVQSFSNRLHEEQLFCHKNITGVGPSYTIFTFLLAVLVSDGSIYVLGKVCPRLEEEASVNAQAGILCRVPPIRGEGEIRLIPLSPAVRRVAYYHSCTSSCLPGSNGFTVHSASLKTGGLFRIHTRSHGYPPRSG